MELLSRSVVPFSGSSFVVRLGLSLVSPAILVIGFSVTSGCTSDRSATGTTTSEGETMKLQSVFQEGGRIETKYTGEGPDVSPRLNWSGAPAETKSFALICDDPDAPSRANPFDEPWVHWVIYNLPADATELPEGIPREPTISAPLSACQGTNSWESDNVGYLGPMPPEGSGEHRYYFKLYALDATLDLDPGAATKTTLMEAMESHILAECQLMGTYERQ